MSKQYLRKREYLGEKAYHYYIKYGKKVVFVLMKWISGEYKIVKAKYSEFQGELAPYENFPYKKTVGVIDRIEELLK